MSRFRSEGKIKAPARDQAQSQGWRDPAAARDQASGVPASREPLLQGTALVTRLAEASRAPSLHRGRARPSLALHRSTASQRASRVSCEAGCVGHRARRNLAGAAG
jgi:hypothetical protein